MLGADGKPMPPVMSHRLARAWAGLEEHPDVPSCFPSLASFELWLSSWSHSKDPDVTFCTDCTQQRKDAMVAQKRCHFPNTTFDVDDDGWTRGNRR